MSGNKYADLPDIDTAPDVYETEDIFSSSHTANGDATDDDSTLPTRSTIKTKSEGSGREDLDTSNLISAEDATKKFRKAERKKDRSRTLYVYPESPTSPSTPTESHVAPRELPLSQRLRALQSELAALEHELSDPSNPLIQKEREEENVDPGELIRGLVDVRGRLDKIMKGKEGRGRLVGVILNEDGSAGAGRSEPDNNDVSRERRAHSVEAHSGVRGIVDIDRRVGELEQLLGSSGTTLDETSLLPPPLLPLITRLNSQLTLLTQPRHIDSISRRLKLLLSDLDRASTAQHHRRHPSQPSAHPPSSQLQEQLLPLVNRIAPTLPHIPHILARLRTLSTLHTSAGEFQNTLEDLEQEQKKIHNSLQELQIAVETVEKSLGENRTVVRENVAGLDNRVNALLRRLEDLSREQKN